MMPITVLNSAVPIKCWISLAYVSEFSIDESTSDVALRRYCHRLEALKFFKNKINSWDRFRLSG